MHAYTATRSVPLRCLLAALLALVTTSAMAAATLRESLRERVTDIRAGEQVLVGNTPIRAHLVLPALYERHDYAPIWVNPDAVDQLIDAVRQVDRDGLLPADYHLAELVAYRNRIRGARAYDPALTADFDLLLTDALVRLAYHLSFGKVDPEAIDPNWNMARYLDDLDNLLPAAAIASGKVDQLVQSLRPDSILYERMRMALARYRHIADSGGWARIPPGKTLEPGSTGERVLALRARLIATGDLDSRDHALPSYDEAVAAGVMNFQRRHGLAVDGKVGRKTLGEMNIRVAARIEQIRANLERARWLLHDLPDTYVMVNIPGYDARMVRDGEQVWESRVQVGRAKRQSPVFHSMLTYLDLNPTWTVPPTILEEDLFPEVRNDLAYLEGRNMRVLDFDGNEVDPWVINWDAYTGKNFPWLVRQSPGPGNALGRIKFMFPNRHSVYLHDTPSKSLFRKSERAFSSGCVRIEKPWELAELLLEANEDWDGTRLQQTIRSRQTKSVNLKQPVPIYLTYWTVDVSEPGVVGFRRDIYKRDVPIVSALTEDFEFRATDVARAKAELLAQDGAS